VPAQSIYQHRCAVLSGLHSLVAFLQTAELRVSRVLRENDCQLPVALNTNGIVKYDELYKKLSTAPPCGIILIEDRTNPS
jgi:hypothetical protein